jgi:beta-glucosidase
MRNGTDMQLTWSVLKSPLADTGSATARQAIRRAIKNMCYAVANSNAMNGIAHGTAISYTLSPWEIWIIAGDSAWSAAILAGLAWVIIRMRRCRKKTSAA